MQRSISIRKAVVHDMFLLAGVTVRDFWRQVGFRQLWGLRVGQQALGTCMSMVNVHSVYGSRQQSLGS